LSVFFLLCQIWYQLGEYEKSRKYFQCFLKTRTDDNDYYKLVARLLDAKVNAESMDAEKLGLLKGLKNVVHGSELAEQVLKDMAEPYHTDRFTKLPRCPVCEQCPLEEECLTPKKLSIARKIYAEMSANHIDKTKFAWVN
jgi:hypothetical protein